MSANPAAHIAAAGQEFRLHFRAAVPTGPVIRSRVFHASVRPAAVAGRRACENVSEPVIPLPRSASEWAATRRFSPDMVPRNARIDRRLHPARVSDGDPASLVDGPEQGRLDAGINPRCRLH
ncbi:hypothetical protein GCM10009116_00310 [Brevundimonas basaltis]